jgi:hypothetical protein
VTVADLPEGLKGAADDELALIHEQQELLRRRREAAQSSAREAGEVKPLKESIPLEPVPHLVGGPGPTLRVAIGRFIRGLGPEATQKLALASAPERRPTRPGDGRERLVRLARERGVPNDPGVLAVASAPEPPSGEAVAIVLGHICRREQVCLEDWRAAHPGAPDPVEPPPPSVGLLLFVTGDNDTGKTAAGARAVAWHRRGALYVRANSLPPADESLRGVSFDRQEQVARARQRVQDVDLLIVDEVGVESDPGLVTEWASSRFPGKMTILLGNGGGDP